MKRVELYARVRHAVMIDGLVNAGANLDHCGGVNLDHLE